MIDGLDLRTLYDDALAQGHPAHTVDNHMV